ncbi:sigma-70 family RNA polymerase sigma factor [Schlesneria paludicola]|uniref:sigma-70 family RNA polymerase sigma factor n=1 Tax=Schlesneria paludicola TaxID=360056 RepID=UPI000299DD4E|nr:sigma-70 family RNA polymerase sigma factor [Schlesneria paludicola]
MSDSEDIPCCSNRDELARFIESRRPQLLAYIQHNLGPALRKKLEVEDILQEVVLAALNSLQAFAVQGRDPFKLLCQMAEQRIIDAHRHHVAAQKRAVDREVSIDGAVGDGEPVGLIKMLVASMTSPSQAFSRAQKELRLQEVLSLLPDEQREVLRLRYVEGLPTKSVAEQLGKSDGAIRVLLTRTLAKLQRMLGDESSVE